MRWTGGPRFMLNTTISIGWAFAQDAAIDHLLENVSNRFLEPTL